MVYTYYVELLYELNDLDLLMKLDRISLECLFDFVTEVETLFGR